jgi:DNA (cytosine-5)-methyltransferase 1
MDADQLTPELAKDAPRHSMQRLVVHLDLFSGIGGFALAAQMAGGIKTAAFCEIDPWARQVLAKNFPGTPIHDDVRTLKPNDYGRIDLITGGYPCQPFSVGGLRRGKEDDRHLWPVMRGIIADARPRMVLCENVAGHITLGLDEVLSDLEALGYSCGATIIPACAVGAGHRRDRIWIIAHAKREGWEGCQPDNGVSLGAVETHTKPCHGIAETWTQLAGCRGSIRASDGLSVQMVRDATKGAGNAIVPQVAAEILRCMMRVDSLHNDQVEARRK